MSAKPTVWIFSTVWPEPQSSAAGVRLIQWIRFFKSMNCHVTLSSPSLLKTTSEESADLSGVRLLPLPLNRDENIQITLSVRPDLVFFDRFILEEQFGPLIADHCPNALVWLETQDLHFVRRVREERKETWLQDQFTVAPDLYETDTALREIASILRVDHSFVCSTFERDLLVNHFAIQPDKITVVPFLYEDLVGGQPLFRDRQGFVFIGNFRHAPNLDGMRWFRSNIWPEIRRLLPQAKIHVYGAYPPHEVSQWHAPLTGFYVEGPAKNLTEVFCRARVSVAPLRFGAGLKGKILDSSRYDCPGVMTSVGAEGMGVPNDVLQPWTVDDVSGWVKKCVDLHEDEEMWNQAVTSFRLLADHHLMSRHHGMLRHRFEQDYSARQEGRLPCWLSKVLKSETVNRNRYFARWLELKERK